MGVGLYLLIGLNGGTHKMRERYTEIDSKLLPMLPDNQECLSRIKETIPKAGNIASYIQRNSQYPIYQNTDIVYFDEAVTGLEAQLKDLKKAQKFIFMEYHAIEDAEAWHKIQDVLWLLAIILYASDALSYGSSFISFASVSERRVGCFHPTI